MHDYLVWLDHNEARVLHVQLESFDKKTDEQVEWAPTHLHHRHPRPHGGAAAHPDDAKHFFQDIARSLTGSDGVLVVGPSTAKLAFIRYLHEHDHALERRIVGIETVDHPTDKQLVAYARHYFHADAPRAKPVA